MSRFGTPTRWRMLLAALLAGAAALAVLAVTAPSSEAAPPSSCSYYSDAGHTTLVGQYGYDCCNNRVAWGTKTAESECGSCFLCTPPAP